MFSPCDPFSNCLLPGVQAGAIFVNQSVETYLNDWFSKGSMDPEDKKEAIGEGLESFEMGAKKAFSGSPESKMIKVGGQRLTDKSLGIRRGSLTITGLVT
jgi:hypothetical protein